MRQFQIIGHHDYAARVIVYKNGDVILVTSGGKFQMDISLKDILSRPDIFKEF